MPLDVKWTVTIPAEELKKSLRHQIFLGIQDVYAKDIAPEAKRLTPYLTGHNRRMIDYEVTEMKDGVMATLFSQSGYGGYLELGHYAGAADVRHRDEAGRFRKRTWVPAQPYLYPAFAMYKNRIAEACGVRIRTIRNLVMGER